MEEELTVLQGLELIEALHFIRTPDLEELQSFEVSPCLCSVADQLLNELSLWVEVFHILDLCTDGLINVLYRIDLSLSVECCEQ